MAARISQSKQQKLNVPSGNRAMCADYEEEEIMYTVRRALPFAFLLALFMDAPAARAQWAVIDVGAITQLLQEVQTMQQQLSAAENQLLQARQEYQSITGNRGMQNLLAMSSQMRNYLPTNWTQLSAVMSQSSATYGALGASTQGQVSTNAVLTPQQLNYLPPDIRTTLGAARGTAALRQATSRTAFENSSNRFQSIQQLINAIPAAQDQKGILELQARIGAEQGMLQNEQTKLQLLHQILQAEDAARNQQELERSIAGNGRFATRFRPTP
jgi:type IV secretion system protein VirB5